jgi:asparagine synthase (glutamine-hydrolysing)
MHKMKDYVSGALTKIQHRGPDHQDMWSDSESNLILGHARLSILDLSSAGSQPMKSHSGRYVIVFNGEIYNSIKLKKEIQSKNVNIKWRGHSDTEVLLACFDTWGIKKTLERLVGMFAIAMWDTVDRKLILSRDRFGEKPLYYGFLGDTFVFASELKAISSLSIFNCEVDRDALSLYVKHLYVPTPKCIYKGLYKLQPGSWTEINLSSFSQNNLPEPKNYWSAKDHAVYGEKHPNKFSSDNDAINQLEFVLQRSISDQMISDVPIGAFLSGGIDSSTVVALMQKNSHKQINTFSIGFNEDGYDEARHASLVAKHLNTNHTELYVNSNDAINIIPSLPTIYDEPFADSSQIPTYLVSKLAKESVTVSLSGDGGDEIFAGYNRYFVADGPWKRLVNIPIFFRRLIANIITNVSPSHWDSAYNYYIKFIPRNQISMFGDKIYKMSSILTCNNIEELYNRLISLWDGPNLVIGANKIDFVDMNYGGLQNNVSKMMLADINGYLMDDILVKVDRAAMANSLETRIPLLDHRIYEFASTLPYHYKIRNGTSKWILRELLYRHVPKQLIERPKMGFGIPIDYWLRTSLKDWAENYLSVSRLKNENYFNYEEIRIKWEEHISGKRNWGLHLWTILMFESWLEQQKNN